MASDSQLVNDRFGLLIGDVDRSVPAWQPLADQSLG
jgi:hypothetical protein